MKQPITILLSLIVYTQLYPQRFLNVDSAKKRLQVLLEDTAKANLLHQIAGSYQFSNTDSAFHYAMKEYDLAQRLNYSKGLANAYGDFSDYYSIQGNGARMLEYAYKMRPIAKRLNDRLLIAYCYSQISVGNGYLQNYVGELLWQKKAFAIGAFFGPLEKAFRATNLGSAYVDIKQPDSAQFYFLQAYKIFNDLHDKPALYAPLDGLIKTRFALGKLEKGKEYCYELISLANSIRSTALVALGYWELASQYLKEQKIDSSLYYARNSISIVQSLNMKNRLEGGYKILIKDFQLIHQRDSAFAYQSKLLDLKDTIEAENNRIQLESFAFEEKMQEKEKADAIQKATEGYQHRQDKIRNLIIIFSLLTGLFVVGVIGLILYRNNIRKQKANKLLQQQKERIQETLAELKNTQKQLIQQEKMASLGELTAGIAHEIQNPLNFVNNFSEVSTELVDEMEEALQQDDKEEAVAIASDIKDNLRKIHHHGKRADAIVKGMLEHSRTSKGEKHPTDINALADEYLRLSYHGLRAKDKDFNADFKTDFDESIGKVEVVPQDIGRVLLNLFNNAFYAASLPSKGGVNEDRKPSVWVTTKRDGDQVIISVKDNGPGIPPNIADKIFQPFFTTKPTGQGTGLGLSLSYDIVKAHGGEIKVESKEGEGSTFIIELPLNQN